MIIRCRIYVLMCMSSFSKHRSAGCRPVFGAMPPKHTQRVWQPKGSATDPRWYRGVAHRLDIVREGLATSAEGGASSSTSRPADAPPSAAAASSSASAPGPQNRGVQPRGQPGTPDEELAAMRLGRAVPASFNLQRHAVMVCGRPVVAP